MHNLRMKLMRTVWIFRDKIENWSSCALVLHMTSNLIISRRSQDKNGKEFYQNVKRTCRACRAIIFAGQPVQHMSQHHVTMLQDVALKCCERLPMQA